MADPLGQGNPINAPITGKQALQQMAKALRNLNYQGTVAFLRNDKLEPMKYFHASHNGLEQERLLSLNSPLREIVREHGKVSCLYKQTQQLKVDNRPFDRSFLVDLPESIDELDDTYDINIVGEENIAMLPAYVITLRPQDSLRYSRAFWVEKQHFLPLQVIVYGPADEILEQLVFIDISVKDNLPFVDTQASNSPALANNPASLSLTEANFTFNNLPAGFHQLFFTRRLMHNEASPVDHMLLSDGLAWVSVYMEYKKPPSATPPPVEPNDIPAVGAINFFSRSLGDYEFTVMGDVPKATVEMIAQNIQLRHNR